MHAIDGFHMREHFVDVGDPQANMPRPADVVRSSGEISCRPRRVMKDKQLQKQILRSLKGTLRKRMLTSTDSARPKNPLTSQIQHF